MKGNYPLSRAKLYRALKELLRHSEVKLDLAALRYGGTIIWDDICPPTNIRIRVDANSNDLGRFVVHELLHVIIAPMVKGRLDETLEEVVNVALDSYMWAYIEKSPARRIEWDKLVKAKVDEDRVDVPIERQVQR